MEKYRAMDESAALEELKRLNFNTLDFMIKSWVDCIMEYNSIDPKFRDYVIALISHSLPESRQMIISFYNLIPEHYTEDIECGKKLHEMYSDKLYDFTKAAKGENYANSRYAAIKLPCMVSYTAV